MKTLMTTLLFLISLTCFSQATTEEPKPTTDEEYNYLTKGYKVQVESGLDMKKGYNFQDMGEVNQGSYNFNFQGLIRETKNELAAILVITKSQVSGRVYYICIPVNNPDLLGRYLTDITAWDESLTTSYCYVVSAYLGSMTSHAFELDKTKK
jgi:hypothetical protein